ncbi:MAG: acetylxylan esterase [Verrucomicrobia bacterium]|nr:acetylxylan esterase [Verrucomicrobiota bacterium]
MADSESLLEPRITRESDVPAYALPDPLADGDGRVVTTRAEWESTRRPQILDLFSRYVYGRSPAAPARCDAEMVSHETRALGGSAIRKQLELRLMNDPSAPTAGLLIYLPAKARGPVPLFLGLNFHGNHTVHADPGIFISENRRRHPSGEEPDIGDQPNPPRGEKAHRWQIEKLLSRGYGLATIYRGDIEPDNPDGWRHGIRNGAADLKGQPDGWAAISAWAYALSRAMDYCETDSDIDATRVAVMGHSRLGKTALWAGAQDQRFALVISNNSGCGGAALSRRRFGETVAQINKGFPHWFCHNFKQFNRREDDLPLDQHFLMALMAPRPVYIASAQEDLWADPRGEFLSGRHADPVYHLYGKRGLETDAYPPVNQSIGASVGYHVRTGQHDVTAYDWEQFLNFADRHMR